MEFHWQLFQFRHYSVKSICSFRISQRNQRTSQSSWRSHQISLTCSTNKFNKLITNLAAKNAVRRCSNDCHSTSSICFESFNSCQWAFTKTNWNSRERFSKEISWFTQWETKSNNFHLNFFMKFTFKSRTKLFNWNTSSFSLFWIEWIYHRI